MPMAGRLIKMVAAARFTNTMGILLQAGLPIVAALEAVEVTVGNAVLAGSLAKVRYRVKEGRSINGPLGETDLLEPMAIQMIALGEETGRLDQMMMHVASHYEREVKKVLKTLNAVIEPALILFVAGLVGAVIVAILQPLLELMSKTGL